MKDLDVDNNVYSGLNPTEGEMIDGISYQVTIEDEWEEMMERVDSGESPYENASDDPTAGVSASAGDGTTTTTTSTGSAMDDVDAVHKGDIEVLNGSGANGAAAAAANLLEKAGYTATTGVADSSDYQEITIVYRGDDSMAIAKGVGETLSSLGTINYVNDSSHTYSYTGDVLVILGSD